MRPDLSSLTRRLSLDTPLIAGEALAVMLSQSRGPVAAEWKGVAEARAMLQPKVERVGDLAIVPINGILARNPDPYEMAFYGVEDMNGIEAMLREVTSDPNISGVLLAIDSPGGFVNGTPELGDLVARLAKVKPTVAFTAGMMCSAAYWLGSQANEIVASRSSIVGSIGVYSALYDVAAWYAEMGVKVEVFTNKEATFKAAGLPGTSLSEDQRAYFSDRVQRDFKDFSKAILAARPGVPADAMRGQTFNGSEAKANSLVDRVGDLGFALSVLRQKMKAKAV